MTANTQETVRVGIHVALPKVAGEFNVPSTEYMITDAVNSIMDHTSAANGMLNISARALLLTS